MRLSLRDRLGKLLFGHSYLSECEMTDLHAVVARLSSITSELNQAVRSVGFKPIPHRRGFSMNSVIQNLIDKLNGIATSDEGILVFVQSVPGLITDEVNKALAAGATAEQLAGLTVLATNIEGRTKAITDAIAANTTPVPAPAPAPVDPVV